MDRQPSLREATFSKGGDAAKMSDLKAPTYKYRRIAVERHASRKSGLDVPTCFP
jgi:hypothetical protein